VCVCVGVCVCVCEIEREIRWVSERVSWVKIDATK
jgi:hypothetical protein